MSINPMQKAQPLPDARLNQSGQASGAMRQRYGAGASAGRKALAAVRQWASGMETTNTAEGRKKPSSFGAHQIAGANSGMSDS